VFLTHYEINLTNIWEMKRVWGNSLRLENLTILLISRGSSNKSFIIFSSTGEVSLTHCKISLADAWETKRVWGGTFMKLEGGSCLFSYIEFTDIIVNDTNTFMVSVVMPGKSLRFENSKLTRCGCLGGGVGGHGAPLNVDITNDGVFSMTNMVIEDCRSIENKVQILYVKINTFKNVEFKNVSFGYGELPSDKVVLVETEFCSFANEFLMNETFRTDLECLNAKDFGKIVFINYTPLSEMYIEIATPGLSIGDVCMKVADSICFWLVGNDTRVPPVTNKCIKKVYIFIIFFFFSFLTRDIYIYIFTYIIFKR
jgi:hypothetical protein